MLSNSFGNETSAEIDDSTIATAMQNEDEQRVPTAAAHRRLVGVEQGPELGVRQQGDRRTGHLPEGT